ncbi:hypothetical protein [Bacillus cereus]|uniref:hypothetical protein n=1 Tax=Bacillus cereus TaxID=1396 RepID=UPI0024BC05DA|nr:hypothetical protein [Bacillus cereus]
MGLIPLQTNLTVVGDFKTNDSFVLAATPSLKALITKKVARLYEIPCRKNITYKYEMSVQTHFMSKPEYKKNKNYILLKIFHLLSYPPL